MKHNFEVGAEMQSDRYDPSDDRAWQEEAEEQMLELLVDEGEDRHTAQRRINNMSANEISQWFIDNNESF